MKHKKFQNQSYLPSTTKALLVTVVIGAGALLSAAPAKAAVLTGIAAGTDLDVDVSAVSLVSLQVGPLATAQVSSPAPNNQSNGVLSVNQSVALGSVTAQNGGLNALNATAQSNVTGLANTGFSTGSSSIKNLTVTVVPAVVLVNPSLLSITSSTIGSTTTSSGQYGALTSVGTSVLENLAISVTGVSITIPVNPAPNTVLVLTGLGINSGIVAGLSIILNEQFASGNGVGSTGLTTNAVHVTLNALSFGGVSGINGDIVIGSSSASLTAIPEPSVFAFVGAASLALVRRRRNG